jgi:hypothetical protein
MTDLIQLDLGGGARLAIPAKTITDALIERLRTQPPTGRRPRIGEHMADEGGIFAGDILGDDGVTYGLIVSAPEDIGRAKWGPDGERDLSDWDGLNNTTRLRNAENPAAHMARNYVADGHTDFYLPARREFLIAAANLPHLFGKESYYWTSTPSGSRSAWAVDFEYGLVSTSHRSLEVRVRPFRRFTY